MFRKILIANRGEIAIRVISACRELGIPSVAVYSTADCDSLHTRLADEAICIGPPAAKDSYLDCHAVLSAAIVTGADAIHPGYGFLAENPTFAELCEQCKIKFIGPPTGVIEMMGNKSRAKEKMRTAGVPIIPGTRGSLNGDRDARSAAKDFGFPLIIKASAGGGGKGMRVVHSESDLARVLVMAKTEAEASFGNAELYIEKYVEEPRHVEVQILADEHGNVIHLGERDCSLQTARHQKMLEESPCPALTPALQTRICEAAVRGAKAVGYANVGTMEFLLSDHNEFFFMEMNTRIQVEHPVTEMVTGIDIVKEQIAIAAGERLRIRQRDVRFTGHAIECRITAEDPARKFTPSSGKIDVFIPPGGIGVRVDTHIHSGYVVPPYYDSLLAKIITHGRDRKEAIARMERALAETQLEGLKTTLPFHQKVLQNAFFRKGEVYTNFLHRRMGESL